MKEDSIFYPNAILKVIHNDDFWLFLPFVIFLFPLWYIMDVIANILDWMGIKILDFSIWVLTKMEKYEKMHKGSKNVKNVKNVKT